MTRSTFALVFGAVIVTAALGYVAWHERTRPMVRVVPATHTAPRIATQPVPPPANCQLPGPPPVAPDGATASLADMKLGQTVIQNFVLQLEAYQTCRDNQADHALPGTSGALKDEWIRQGDDAVDEAHALADAFSAQLRIFKARGER